MVTCQSSELGWEVTVELQADFLSLGKGSVKQGSVPSLSHTIVLWRVRWSLLGQDPIVPEII